MNDLISRKSIYKILNKLDKEKIDDDWVTGWEQAISTIASELEDIPSYKGLKRSEAKKPVIRETYNYFNGEPTDIIECENCECTIGKIEWEDMLDDDKIKKFAEKVEIEYLSFCTRCGQEMDWSVEE